MTTIISFAIVLGILIFIHELGHFLVAKWCGVGVETFSIGFGPKIYSFQKDETTYQIALLPLGGYVKMYGQDDMEAVKTDEQKEEEAKTLPPDFEEKNFNNKTIAQKCAIVFAGPLMNVALTIVILPVAYMIGVQVPAYLEKQATVGYLIEGSPAKISGMKQFDVIKEVNSKEVKNWEELNRIIALNPKKDLDVTLLRKGRTLNVTLTPKEDTQMGGGYAGIIEEVPAIIGAVSKDSPAHKSGMRVMDKVISINGKKVNHWMDLPQLISKDATEKEIKVLRDDKELTFNLKPSFNEEREVFIIGVSPYEETVMKRYGLVGSVSQGLYKTWDMTNLFFITMKGLFVGDFSIKNLGGPIMIASVAGKAAESGITSLLFLMAFLSLQLGIINLFPIPVLDGGHLVFYAIEYVKGSPLSDTVMYRAQTVGMVLLLTLMVVVTFNDILRLF